MYNMYSCDNSDNCIFHLISLLMFVQQSTISFFTERAKNKEGSDNDVHCDYSEL